MISEGTFNEIIQKTKECKYSSLSYSEHSDCANADILYYKQIAGEGLNLHSFVIIVID